ncbi:MAG: MaoC family dehydratase [Deltaproteobacteria bacterium]
MSDFTRTLSFDEVEVGHTLPELTIDVSATRIIATAIASRDYQDVHHDLEAAQKRGTKSIIMNILTTNGLVDRFVTDWAGPDAFLRRVNIRLGVPNYAGDTMVLSGVVKEKSEADGQAVVDIDIVGKNSLGNHVTGVVRVALPKGN